MKKDDEGNSKNNKNNFFLWLAAANPDILRLCPSSERTRQAAIGATILIPAIFSIVASSYIAFNLNINGFVSFLIPVVWCFVILTLDRALLATYQSKFIQILFRIALAVLVSITVSHPVTLSIFHDIIDDQIYKKYKAPEIKRVKEEFDSKQKELMRSNSGLQKEKEEINKEMHECNSDPSFTQKYSSNTISLKAEKQTLTTELENIQDKVSELHLEARNEKIGKGKTQKSGEGPVYRSILKKIETLGDEVDFKEKRIRELNKKIIKSMDEDEENTTELQRKRKENCEKISNKISKRLEKITTRMDNNDKGLLTLSKDRMDKINEIDQRKSDILQKTLALHDIFNQKNGGKAAFYIFVAFVSLFILIDTIPILLKIFSKGCYEHQLGFNDLELKHKEKIYPGILKDISTRQVKNEINLRHQHRTLSSISMVLENKSAMLYDFLEIRKKYINYLHEYFGLDPEKSSDLIESENLNLMEFLKKDNENLVKTFFESRIDDLDESPIGTEK